MARVELVALPPLADPETIAVVGGRGSERVTAGPLVSPPVPSVARGVGRGVEARHVEEDVVACQGRRAVCAPVHLLLPHDRTVPLVDRQEAIAVVHVHAAAPCRWGSFGVVVE